MLLPIRFGGLAWAQPIPGGSLDPINIPKYVTPLVIPPQMPPTSRGPVDYYEIAVRQFQQQILPEGHPATTVWSYGSVNHPNTFNYPAFTIEADYHRPVRVKWINDLVDKGTSCRICYVWIRRCTGRILRAARRIAIRDPHSPKLPGPTRALSRS